MSWLNRSRSYTMNKKIIEVVEKFKPCYLSFDSALVYWDLSNAPGYALSFATLWDSYETSTDGYFIGFINVPRELFWGFEKREDLGLYVAKPTKALLDTMWRYYDDLETFFYPGDYDLEEISKEEFKKYTKRTGLNYKFPEVIRRR